MGNLDQELIIEEKTVSISAQWNGLEDHTKISAALS